MNETSLAGLRESLDKAIDSADALRKNLAAIADRVTRLESQLTARAPRTLETTEATP